MSAGPFPSPALVMAANFVNIGVNIPFAARFIDTDSQHMARTLADSDGTEWTLSFWMKRGFIPPVGVGNPNKTVLSAAVDVSNFSRVYVDNSGAIHFTQTVGGSIVSEANTDAFFRDPTAWYHVVVNYDSDQAVSTDRIKMTINGTEQEIITVNAIDLGRSVHINENVEHNVGRRPSFNDNFYEGLLAEVNFIDGLTKVATEFGKENKFGHWIPKRYTGAYGTNGFRFDFANNIDYGNDVSGNANDFTDSGLTTASQAVDTPTDNAASFNTIESNSNLTTSQANLKATTTVAAYTSALSTQWADRDKWYWEVVVDNVATEENVMVGWLQFPGDPDAQIGSDDFGWALQFQTADNTADVIHNGVVLTTLTPAHDLIAGDRIGMAIDIDAGKIWWRINGVYIGGGDPATGAGANVTDASITGLDGRFGVSINASGNDCTGVFDKDTVVGSIPTGFKTFQVSSYKQQTYASILKPSDFFDILLYTGDGVSEVSGGQSIIGLDFSPNIVWVKSRSLTTDHAIADTEQGVEKYWEPQSALAQISNIESLVSFDLKGFTIGNDSQFNTNAATYVAWCWKQGIKQGLDIINYTGNGSAGATIAHNLGAPPDLVIAKRLDTFGTPQFGSALWLDTLDSSGVPITDPETDYLEFGNQTFGLIDDITLWNDTAPSASVITLGTNVRVNESGRDYICYAFRNIPGYSKFGSFVGNAAVDGAFIHTGFRTAFFLVKRTDTAVGNWQLHDMRRTTQGVDGNEHNAFFFVDVTNAESGGVRMDFLSNGFKQQTSFVGNYIYMAFAEHPFKYARAR